MTHTNDDSRRQRSPLDFPEHLGIDERAARWAELLARDERLTDQVLDDALFELMQRSRQTS